MGKIDPSKKTKRGKEMVSGGSVPVPKNTMETCVLTPLPDDPTKEEIDDYLLRLTLLYTLAEKQLPAAQNENTVSTLDQLDAANQSFTIVHVDPDLFVHESLLAKHPVTSNLIPSVADVKVTHTSGLQVNALETTSFTTTSALPSVIVSEQRFESASGMSVLGEPVVKKPRISQVSSTAGQVLRQQAEIKRNEFAQQQLVIQQQI